MLMEGINLRLKLSRKGLRLYGRHRHKIKYLCYFVGWLIPLTIVTISAAVGFHNSTYMARKENTNDFLQNATAIFEMCWLSTKSQIRVTSVLIPLGIVVVTNISIAIHVAVFVIRLKKSDNKSLVLKDNQQDFVKVDQIISGFKTIIVLSPTLGLSWILMFFTST